MSNLGASKFRTRVQIEEEEAMEAHNLQKRNLRKEADKAEADWNAEADESDVSELDFMHDSTQPFPRVDE